MCFIVSQNDLGSEQSHLGKAVPVCGRKGGLADPQGSLPTQTIQ